MTRFHDTVNVSIPVNCTYAISEGNVALYSVEIAGGAFTQLSDLPNALQNQIAFALIPAIREYEKERVGAFDGRI